MNMLAKLIKGCGLNQRELAEQLGATPAVVSPQVKHCIKSIRVAKNYAQVALEQIKERLSALEETDLLDAVFRFIQHEYTQRKRSLEDRLEAISKDPVN